MPFIGNNIVMVDYSRSLKDRKQNRKILGPYRWVPTNPGSSCTSWFYMAGRGIKMYSAGSSFRLRLRKANDYIKGKLRYISGYYYNEEGTETIEPIIALLPRNRGFLAGWTMGQYMLSGLDLHIHPTALEAALAAHDEAERVAEREREYQDSDS